MLFTIDKNKSLSILQIAMTLFIIIAPSIFGFNENCFGAYFLMLFTGALFLMRMKSTGQVCISFYHIPLAVLFLYSVLTFFWASNKGDHVTYMAMILNTIMFLGVSADYFGESAEEKYRRRLMYMISFGAIVLALFNVFYWIIYLVPFGDTRSLSAGMGSNSFLAVFMVLSVVITCNLMKKNSKFRRFLFAIGIILMTFVFVMAKSSIGWIFAALLCIIYLISLKYKKAFLSVSLAAVFIFSLIAIIGSKAAGNISVFSDVFTYGIKNFVGRGGGFWSAKGLFLNANSSETAIPGMMAFLSASSGVTGVLCAAVTVVISAWQFVRLRSWESLVHLFLTVMLMILPLAKSFAVVLLWAGLGAYNEKEALLARKRNIGKTFLKRAVYTMYVSGVLVFLLLGCEALKYSGDRNYEKGKYIEAYRLYSSASYVNLTDSESCRKAVQSLYESDKLSSYYERALEMSDMAKKRDKNNLENSVVKAQVYYKCGRYDLSSKEYEALAAKAKIKDDYNIALVNALYQIVKTSEKGSAETKSAYDRMVQIAGETTDLDLREKINNIADKALAYTKGELSVENED